MGTREGKAGFHHLWVREEGGVLDESVSTIFFPFVDGSALGLVGSFGRNRLIFDEISAILLLMPCGRSSKPYGSGYGFRLVHPISNGAFFCLNLSGNRP